MTGYKSSYFRHRCSRDGCYYDQLPNWDDLIECFPRRIRPTDIDGMVEVNGNFLFLEEKGPGKGPDEGQRRALLKLSTRPGISIVFFRPPKPGTPKPGDLEYLVFEHGRGTGWRACSREELKDWLRSWSSHADRLGREAS